MNRREFMRFGGAGLATSATMLEAGLLSEFIDWMRRKPSFSIPKHVSPWSTKSPQQIMEDIDRALISSGIAFPYPEQSYFFASAIGVKSKSLVMPNFFPL